MSMCAVSFMTTSCIRVWRSSPSSLSASLVSKRSTSRWSVFRIRIGSFIVAPIGGFVCVAVPTRCERSHLPCTLARARQELCEQLESPVHRVVADLVRRTGQVERGGKRGRAEAGSDVHGAYGPALLSGRTRDASEPE